MDEISPMSGGRDFQSTSRNVDIIGEHILQLPTSKYKQEQQIWATSQNNRSTNSRLIAHKLTDMHWSIVYNQQQKR